MIKNIAISLLLAMALSGQAARASEATDKLTDKQYLKQLEKKKHHGLAYKLTHLGLVHKVAKVASIPGFVLGFTIDMVGGLIAIPIEEGMEYFESQPFVSW